jgi:hypothetical protein
MLDVRYWMLDAGGAKRRLALVLTDLPGDDIILFQITS